MYNKKSEKKKTTKKNSKAKNASETDSMPLFAAGAEEVGSGE